MAPAKLGGLDRRVLSAVALALVILVRGFLKKRRAEPDCRKDADPEVTAEAGEEYDVFLSFRGPDNRNEFTDSLYCRLKDAGVRTFRDDEELRVGQEIGPELIRAIRQSKISVPIFSKGYASSKWCLEEVAEMVKHMGETKHMIMPIFLDVTPNEVQHQTGSYAEAFSQHEKNFDSETVRKWRDALKKVVKLKGLELKKEASGKHGEFIKKVLARVLNSLKKVYLDVNEILVGIDDHVEAVKTRLQVGNTGVQIIGIWGMGGIGKTTLAKVVYNQLLDKFESSCFLNDIRETSLQHNGLVYLQSRLVSDILNCERIDFANRDEGTQQLKNRLRGKKAIILLDDVDQVDQLKALAGDLAWFGQGSRIIITTREKIVLDLFRVSNIYELPLLSDDQAFELFCKHALIKGLPAPDFVDLSWEIVRATGRLPLALVVIGSSLSISSGKKKKWESTLQKLKTVPNRTVQDTLRISYDGLERLEKEIFLDIACFFIGADARIAISIWDDCKFCPDDGIEILRLKSIITITDDNKLWMHDQLRDMGREIVDQENYKDPRLRSRLWHGEEAMRVLERQPKEGITKVEAISLEGYQFGSEDHCFKADQFKNLFNLRILQLDKAGLAGNFECLLPDLRWLSWHFCTFNPGPPTNLDLKNLIVLDLSRSTVSENWAGWSSIKVAARLKVLNLTSCLELRETPDFSAFPVLERLILKSCRNLVFLDPSMEQLSHLVSLDIRNCIGLKHVPQLGAMDALTELLVDGTFIQELPISRDTDKLKSLEKVSAKNCRLLATFPGSVECLEKLKQLSFDLCRSLRIIPDFIGRLSTLTELSLSDTPVKRLPDSIGNLSLLNVLKINDSGLTCLPSTLSTLENLQVLNASRCIDLEGEIPINTGSESSLRILQLDYTKVSTLPTGISRLCRLEILHLEGCERLQTLPALPSSLISLKLGGNLIQTFPNLENLTKLKELVFLDCCKLLEVPSGIGHLSKLETLVFSATSISSLPEEVGTLPHLRELWIDNCKLLEYLPKLPSHLYVLQIISCLSLTRLPNLSNLNSLSQLSVSQCPGITEIPGLRGLTFLKSLDISGCPIAQLDSLEMLELTTSLYTEFNQTERLPVFLWPRRLLANYASRCTELSELSELYSQYNMTNPIFTGCSYLDKSMDSLSLRYLTSLKLQDVKTFPVGGWEKLKLLQLKVLKLSQCGELEFLPALSKLCMLQHLALEDCENLTEIPGLGDVESLEFLEISNCKAVEKLSDLSKLQRLSILVMKGCGKLRGIPGLEELNYLYSLDISQCKSFEKLPNLSNLQNLRILEMQGCYNLTEIQGLEELDNLRCLDISQCKLIEKVPNLSKLQKLTRLKMQGCYNLMEIPGLEELGNLNSLNISQCKSIKKVPNLSKLQKMKRLEMQGCDNLIEIPGLEELGNLHFLDISQCKSIEKAPNLSKLQKLRWLEMQGCCNLTEIPGLEVLRNLHFLDISQCKSIKTPPNLLKV